jgi:hypothetical protein
MDTVTIVLAALVGVHVLLKFTFFLLPYERRRAALDKAYAGGKLTATATSDAVSLAFCAVLVIVVFITGVSAVSFLIGLWVGATLIQLYFHRYWQPLDPDKAPPPPSGPIKLMSYAIEARPWKPWPEIAALCVLVIAGLVALAIGAH